jgi:plastocyanin
MRHALMILAVLMTLTLVACGGDSGESGESADAGSGTADSGSSDSGDAIVIKDFSFGDPVSVSSGASVTAENEDNTMHTWTSDDGLWDSGNLRTGDTFEFTFDEAGEYPFHCQIHRSMTGTVTVTG